jgi:SAM-dependent methyltransferase
MNDALYRQAAKEYAQHSMRSLFNANYERPAMLALLGSIRGKTVLDAACAGGAYIAELIDRQAHVIALDHSPEFVDIVKKRFGAAVDVRKHDLREPLQWLADESVDLVVSSLTMHYLRVWDIPMREFGRVLKSSGRLLLSTHHPAMTGHIAQDYFKTALVKETWNVGGREHEVTFYHRPLHAILSAIIDAGFVVRRILEPPIAEPNNAAREEYVARRRQDPNLSLQPWLLIIEATRP